MKKTPLYLLTAIALANLLTVPHTAFAKPTEPPAASPAPAAAPDSPPALAAKEPSDADAKDDSQKDNTLVSIGHDSTLAAGEHATAVISVLGSSTSAGQVDQ